MYRNRIAIDLAKDVFQIAVSPRPGFSRFLRDLPEPTELVMETTAFDSMERDNLSAWH